MKYSVALLCIVLGLIAFVEASVIARDSNLLAKRNAYPQGRNRQCESNSETPSPADTPTSSSDLPSSPTTSKILADSGKVNGGRGRNRGGRGAKASTSATVQAADTTSAAAPPASSEAAPPPQDTATATDTGSQGGSSTCLAANALQTGSESTGQNVANITAGQVSSETDDANFINVCAGQVLTNGKQVITGSCNGIPLGFIPAKTQMPSSLITSPQHNEDIAADTTFNITISMTNMELGHFTNAELTYYSAPTKLNGAGLIIGHTHITCQDLGGSFTPSAPLDASKFAFFLGINNAGDGNGNVQAKVPNGLPAGFYRCCTLISNANHSPVQMPVAQRGTQDDCRYFSTGQTPGNAGPAVVSSAAAPAPPAGTSAAAAPPAGTSSAPAAGASAGSQGRQGHKHHGK